jgi:hypothetical protein
MLRALRKQSYRKAGKEIRDTKVLKPGRSLELYNIALFT